jgi:hypothetical protein
MPISAPIKFLITAFAALTFVLSTGCEKDKEQKAALRAVWAEYTRTANDNDGPGAAKILNKNALAYYDKILKAGLTAKASEVAAMRPCDQFEICRMRNRATRKELQGYTGKGFVIYTTNQGWYSGFGDEDFVLKNIKINGSTATAELTEVIPDQFSFASNFSWRARLREEIRKKNQKQARKYPLKFEMEDGVWKIDDTSLQARTDEELIAAAKAYRMSVQRYIMAWEEAEWGKDVSPTVWEPMK